jgi:hypothetical protein
MIDSRDTNTEQHDRSELTPEQRKFCVDFLDVNYSPHSPNEELNVFGSIKSAVRADSQGAPRLRAGIGIFVPIDVPSFVVKVANLMTLRWRVARIKALLKQRGYPYMKIYCIQPSLENASLVYEANGIAATYAVRELSFYSPRSAVQGFVRSGVRALSGVDASTGALLVLGTPNAT